eukprot:TRINITY_DN335_c0_g2_i1.p1 TRINITY_DN335_c0_g2~~TRINITY_DN335_c0_g2_i1.p1  ORF type:complete len:206 (+),score=27.72 TRINITY_DN335_c0_g2_i1:74-691(+)
MSNNSKMIYTGKVHRWMSERGYGFIKTATLPQDIMVRFPAIGGGNLVVGQEISFQLQPNCQKSIRVQRIIGEQGVNRLWFDQDGNRVDWNVGFRRECRRIEYNNSIPLNERSRSVHLDVAYLTDPADDETAFQKMVTRARETERRIKASIAANRLMGPKLIRPPKGGNEKRRELGRSRSPSPGRHPRDRNPASAQMTHQNTRPRY